MIVSYLESFHLQSFNTFSILPTLFLLHIFKSFLLSFDLLLAKLLGFGSILFFAKITLCKLNIQDHKRLQADLLHLLRQVCNLSWG